MPADLCPLCGTRLVAAGAPCPRCVLAAGREEGPLGAPAGPGGAPGTDPLAGLALPEDELVIAGKYRVLSTLGRGAMGVVHQARQEKLGRVVAVKMLLGGAFADRAARDRFLREAQSVAQLQHLNLVTLHDWGEHDGQPYFAMEYLEGGSLADALKPGPFEPVRAVRLVELVARAAAYAHAQGIVHRDLKPSNILLTRDGQPKIADFGLAKRLDQSSDLTREGLALGTPNYMAPEQASDRFGPVGPHTDVYALGAVLYCLLTGRPPFRARTEADLLRRIVEEEPAALLPRRSGRGKLLAGVDTRGTQTGASESPGLHRAIDRDLDTLCRKCLEKDPARRYPTAEVFADRLRLWLEGKPIPDRPTGVWERTRKWARRKPALARLSLAVVLLVLVGAAGLWWQHQRLGRTGVARQEADTLRRRQAAEKALEAGDLAGAVRALANALRAAPANSPTAVRLVNVLDRRSFLIPVPTPPEVLPASALDLQAAFRIARDAEDRLVAYVTNQVDLAILETATNSSGPRLSVAAHRRVIRSLAASPDGRWIVSASADRAATVWSADAGTAVASLSHPDAVQHASFSPDGGQVATACRDGSVRRWLWRNDPGSVLVMNQGAPVNVAHFSPDARWVVSGGDDGVIRLWDADTGRPAGEPRALDAPVWDARFAAGNPGVIEVRLEGDRVLFLGRTAPNALAALRGVPNPNRQAARWGTDAPDTLLDRLGLREVDCHEVSPDGQRLAAATRERVQIWDLGTRHPVARLVHAGPVEQLCFSRDSGRLATLTAQHRVRVWEVATGLPLMDADDPTVPVGDLRFSEDGTVVTADPDHPWPLAALDGPAPAWLADLADGLVGALGTPDQTPLDDAAVARFLELRRRVLDLQATNELTRWAKRLLDPPGHDGVGAP